MTTTATQTKADPADIGAVKDFPARAARAMGEILEMIEISERLDEAGFPSGGALLNAVSASDTLPTQSDYIENVAEQVRIALICEWDPGAALWWFNRIESEGTIDRCRSEAEGSDGPAAFNSFNNDFESAFPELAQKVSLAVNLIDNPFHEKAGRGTLEGLKPEIKAAFAAVAAGRKATA